MLGSCRRTRLKLAYWAIAALLSLSGTGLAQDAQKDSAGIDFFETKIRPVLVESCYKCHSIEAKKHKGNLLLDSQAALRKGGDTGPAIVPGQPGKSLLVKALSPQRRFKHAAAGQAERPDHRGLREMDRAGRSRSA